MKVIIEGFNYNAPDVRTILHELSSLENIEHQISVNYVGYYYNPIIRDCVFILPKVLIDKNNKVFARFDPHEIINIDVTNVLNNEEKSFLYDFSVWIYRTITVFNKQKPENSIVFQRNIAEVGKGKHYINNTFLDILLSLLRFNIENQQFFITILKNIHSGLNKINWTKTLNKSTVFVQNNEPIYLSPINKKRFINFEEELIVIFYSILNYISHTYGFKSRISLGFNLIEGKKFIHYIKGYGKRRLKQIKYKYFSDKALQLWNLCYEFFDRAYKINFSTEQRDYLLVKNFNIVFEAIIDELVGDNNIPKGLKEQEDGKRVDHIYSFQGLTDSESNKPVYYIGDSKYYKLGNEVTRESVYKQFTYARNVTQWNLDLFLNDDPRDELDRKCMPVFRDDETEGYNIIPNFFISAKMDDLLFKLTKF